MFGRKNNFNQELNNIRPSSGTRLGVNQLNNFNNNQDRLAVRQDPDFNSYGVNYIKTQVDFNNLITDILGSNVNQLNFSIKWKFSPLNIMYIINNFIIMKITIYCYFYSLISPLIR